MPPSRHQTPSHTSHKPPYPKERAGGMRESTRQSSATITGATGTVAKSSPDKKPIIMQESGGGENEDGKMERKRRKRAKRDRESARERECHDDVDIAVNVKSEDREVKAEKPIKSRPLAPLNVPQPQAHSHVAADQHPQSQQTVTPKQTNTTNNAPVSQKNDARSVKLEQKLEKQKMKLKEAEARATADAERSRNDAERIKELEESVKELKGALEAKDEAAEGVKSVVNQHLQTIEKHEQDRDQVKETLTDAVSCMICSDTLQDPHILSCGHFACRDCLKSWFRQPNAYLHNLTGAITDRRDLSYRRKICHVCRSTVLRRPTRMYNVYSFLEPLGLLSEVPLPIAVPAPPPSQESAGDVWANLFPPDRQSYKLHDAEDHTDRCPRCLHEVTEDRCDHCTAEFSGAEDDDDVEFDDDMDFDSDGIAPPSLGMTRARVNIAHVDDVLGTTTDDDDFDRDDEYDHDGERASDDDVGHGGDPQVRAMRAARRRGEPYMFFVGDEAEAEDVDEDMGMDGSGNESTGSSDFARPRSDIERREMGDSDNGSMIDDDDSDVHVERRPRNFINLVTGEIGGAAARGPRTRQTARRTGPLVRRDLIDSEAEDFDEGYISGHREGSVYDSEEDDGSVPRLRFARRGLIHAHAHSDEDEEHHDHDSLDSYGGSFIDDDEEEDGESNETENENDAEQMIQLASSDHEVAFESGEEEREEDGAGNTPNIQEIRRRRLQALIDGRRNTRGPAGRVPAPMSDHGSGGYSD